MNLNSPVFQRLCLWLVVCLGLYLLLPQFTAILGQRVEAQAPKPVPPPAPAAGTESKPSDPAKLADEALAAPEEPRDLSQAALAGPKPEIPRINVWELTKKGGVLMWPIFGVSIIALAFTVERFLGLWRSRVIPPGLIADLDRLAQQKGMLDPQSAGQLCRRYPSSAANVIRSMLEKTGRPQSEVEHAVSEAKDREASRLYYNVRWLNLSVAVAPMLGLLGTIQGMIIAFFDTTYLPPEANKAIYLSKGIYTALVTTFAGLSVAIPAAIIAHMLEGRILRLMGEVDEMVMRLLPQLQRFEGRLRVGKDQLDADDAEPVRAAVAEETKRRSV